MLNINDLPNELLVKIFTNIESLSHVFCIQTVCQKWKAISELTLETKRSLRICNQRLDLSPYGSLTFLKDYFDKRNTLWINCNMLTKSKIDCLIEKMPRIESLELCKLSLDEDNLMTFLTCWQEQLSQLTIIFSRHYMSLSYEKQLSLMAGQYKLRHLYLLCTELSSELMSNLKPLQTIFHFNEKAAAFTIDSYSWLSAVDRVGDQVESIHFINPGLRSEVLERPLPNLKRFSINVDMLENVKFLCEHHTSLTHLDLILYNTECSFMKMLPSLVHLTKLTNLRIATPVRYIRIDVLNALDVFNQRQTVFPFYKVTTRNFKRRLPQLPNVTNLHLSIELKLIRMQFVEHIFPNVVELIFNGPIFRCGCHLPVYGLCRRCSVAILNRLLGIRSLKKVYSNAVLLFNRNQPDTPIPDTVLDSLFYDDNMGENMPLFDMYEGF